MVRDVVVVWYNVYYSKKQKELFEQTDSLYADFLQAAKLKYTTNESSKLEYLSANTKYNRLKVDIKTAESNYRIALEILNSYLLCTSEFDINTNGMQTDFTDSFTDSINNSLLIDFYANSAAVVKSEWRAERANFLPKIDLAYKRQVIDNVSGFNGWQIGFSVPLIFLSQSGKTKAAKLDYKIAEENLEQKSLEIKSKYKQLLNRYLIVTELIKHYKNEALPMADEQIKASKLAYKLGSIGYIQFIRNTETAIEIKKEFLMYQRQFFELSARIKLFSKSKFTE